MGISWGGRGGYKTENHWGSVDIFWKCTLLWGILTLKELKECCCDVDLFVSYVGGLSTVVKTDYFSNFATTLISFVYDFEVFDNYMFATKQVSTLQILNCSRPLFYLL